MMNVVMGLVISLTAANADGSQSDNLKNALTFHAGFDGSLIAGFAKGDPKFYTAGSLARDDARPGNHRDDVTLIKDGRYGSAIRFGDKAKQVVFYRAEKNLNYHKQHFAGTVSFWMRLDPEKDLKPGFADPLQITDKKWNDASFFVDFTKDDTPRHFRLGAFANYKFWNPQDIKWEQVPAEKRPMVVVTKTPFTRERWTHVVFTFADFNTEGKTGTAKLFLDGKLQGTLTREQRYTWDISQAAIMLGLSYIGDMDDLAIFNRALTEAEVQQLYGLKRGVEMLYPPANSN